ncbi:Zona pellucida sperm-binding protein 3 [Labeo rohita]|uniref:Zona pellucida sperm-binding protein 3 n=1 Tax=Labeo rohita TaxID=84645 RepID=A0ABQ8MWQ8_LABRO|nr:zona pellucida sperm-binding protein 3b [Labeo rohita]KAI2667269.1 Zona pellucida sperm-binding protein 3 [Labeo rohita]
MWLGNTVTWCIAVFLTTPLLTECYPRMSPRAFQQLGSLASQQLLSGQFQAAIPQSPPKINDPVPQRRQKTVSVYCHEEAIEVVMNADLFASGIPVYAEELRLGSESLLNKVSAASCGAVQTGESELTIFAYFRDCGTKLSVTGDSLVYSNVIVYSPLPTPDGVIHQEGAVIPVQCQYRRWYNVDSAAVAPTWIPFISTASATDYLDFSLRLMNDDWEYERGSNIYFLGDAIHLQASVTLFNHFPLLLFIDWCVATPTYGVVASDIKYSFVDYGGCLVDSKSLYSHSKFLPRSQGNKLNLLLDAFRFYKLTSNLVFITCSLKAIPAAYSVSSQNRACSFIDGRWQSVDGNDEVCNTCEPSRQAAAEKEPIQPLRITLAPPVKQSVLAPKPGPADFFRVRPGQSLEPFKTLIHSRQYAYGSMSKRGTDSSKDWSKVATLGPLFLIPKQETTTRSTGYPQSGPAEVFSAFVDEEPELLFNSTRESPMTDELDFKTDHETKNGPLVKDLFLNASDLFSSEEGSGFEE